MSGRTGWHGLQTVTEKKMLCLMCNGGDTYYIDLEPNRAGPDVACAPPASLQWSRNQKIVIIIIIITVIIE